MNDSGKVTSLITILTKITKQTKFLRPANIFKKILEQKAINRSTSVVLIKTFLLNFEIFSSAKIKANKNKNVNLRCKIM